MERPPIYFLVRANYKWRGVGLPIRLKPWQIIAEFALSLHNTEDFISKAKKDYDGLLIQYDEASKTVDSK
jgi:hypothetical protein